MSMYKFFKSLTYNIAGKRSRVTIKLGEGEYTNVLQNDESYKMYNEGRKFNRVAAELSLFGDEKCREGIEELSTVFTLHFYHCKTDKKKRKFEEDLEE